MKLAILDVLACPECRGCLKLAPGHDGTAIEIQAGTLECAGCSVRYPVVRGIPRFVEGENYTGSFGYQWTKFLRTQLDENLGIPLSAERFRIETGWAASLVGEVILEAGSGMGRFTRCAAATGAQVFSFDAVTRPGGHLVVDVYRRTWNTLFWGQYYLRVLTRRVPADRLFPLVEAYFRVVHRLSGLVLPINNHASKVLSLMLGTADYRGMYPVAPDVMREWCLLDTFDKLSPAFDYPQTIATITKWFDAIDVASFEVRPGYNGLEIHVRR